MKSEGSRHGGPIYHPRIFRGCISQGMAGKVGEVDMERGCGEEWGEMWVIRTLWMSDESGLFLGVGGFVF